MQVEIVIQSGKNIDFRDAWVVQLVKHLSSAWGAGIGPHVWLPAQWGVCFSLSLCPSPACVLAHVHACAPAHSREKKAKPKKLTHVVQGGDRLDLAV